MQNTYKINKTYIITYIKIYTYINKNLISNLVTIFV